MSDGEGPSIKVGCGCIGCLAQIVVILALAVAIKYLWNVLVS